MKNANILHFFFGGRGVSSIKSSKILICITLEAEPICSPKAALFFLGWFSLLSASPPFPDSVQFSHSVMSNSLWPHELQHARPPCPSPTPGIYSNSCPSSRWCHPAISSSVVLFSSCPQSLLASGSFPVASSFHEVAKVLEFQHQHQSFQDWSPSPGTPRTDLL